MSRAVKILLSTSLLFFTILACLSILNPLDLTKVESLSVEVFDRNGDWLYVKPAKGHFWRIKTEVHDVDKNYLRALIAFEDKRFYSHFGFDPLAMLRAITQLMTNGQIVSGASTISMQVAKLLEPRERTLKAKIIEIFRAFQLEWLYSKEELLGIYITLVPMGGNLEGVKAASYSYFGHSPSRLTWGEIALLISLPQSPEARRPDKHLKSANNARGKVLDALVKKEIISIKDADYALLEPLSPIRIALPRYAPHYSWQKSINDEFKINTSIDKQLQINVEAILKNQSSTIQNYAALILDASSGEELAYVGSAGLNSVLGYNDMVKAVRSPGSTLKPFIYALAFENALIYPKTIIVDEPISISGFSPKNFNSRYFGEVYIEEALKLSLNIPAVKLLDRVGVNYFVNFLGTQGLNLRLPVGAKPSLAISLGGGGVTLFELTKAYRLLSNSNNYIRQSTKSMVYHSLPKLYDFAYKTGTSYGYRDAWAISYNKNYVVGLWSGRPDGVPVVGQTGASTTVPLLKKILNLLPNENKGFLPVENIEIPEKLKRFDREKTKYHKSVIYPSDRQTIFLQNGESINIKLNEQFEEIKLNINDQLIILKENSEGFYPWIPLKEGFYSISFVDSLEKINLRIIFEE